MKVYCILSVFLADNKRNGNTLLFKKKKKIVITLFLVAQVVKKFMDNRNRKSAHKRNFMRHCSFLNFMYNTLCFSSESLCFTTLIFFV